MIGAVDGFRSAWTEPLGVMGQSLGTDRQRRFDELWAWYTSEVFGVTSTRTAARWDSYRGTHKLYRATRLLYNPAPLLVNTYVSTIYPGILPLDARQPPQGVQVAIPLPDDTDPKLRAAIAQLWMWSNWGSEKSAYVRFGAALGSVLLEAVDDAARGKVSIRVWRPEYVPSVTLDTAGNVKAYVLEYKTVDEAGREFLYRREWNTDDIRTFKDGQAAAFGDDDAVRPNPYPFVPAALTRHKSHGGDWGVAAIEAVLPMLRSINSTASMLDDALDRKVRLPFIIFGGAKPTSLGQTTKAGASDEMSAAMIDRAREGVMYWHSSDAEGHVDTLAPTLETADTAAWVRDKISRAEEMMPEITYSRELRSMSTVTGPGAARMLSDVGAIVYEAQSIYDLQLTKAAQMCLAIGGERAKAGQWGAQGSLTRQQSVFTPFDMGSYQRGELDISFLPRPLVPATDRERIDELVQEGVAAAGWVSAGIPLEVFLRRERGWSDEDIAALGQEKIDAIKRQQLLAAEDVVPVVGQ